MKIEAFYRCLEWASQRLVALTEVEERVAWIQALATVVITAYLRA